MHPYLLRIFKSDFWSCLSVNLGSNEFKGYADFGLKHYKCQFQRPLLVGLIFFMNESNREDLSQIKKETTHKRDEINL